MMTNEEKEAQIYEEKRKRKLIRRIVLIGLGILVFIIVNWSWFLNLIGG